MIVFSDGVHYHDDEWVDKLLTICNEVYCMGVVVWGVVGEGLGGRGLEINKIKSKNSKN